MPSITTDLLSGPFLTSAQLTDYSDQPGYAIRLRDVPEGGDSTTRALARVGFTDATRKAA